MRLHDIIVHKIHSILVEFGVYGFNKVHATHYKWRNAQEHMPIIAAAVFKQVKDGNAQRAIFWRKSNIKQTRFIHGRRQIAQYPQF